MRKISKLIVILAVVGILINDVYSIHKNNLKIREISNYSDNSINADIKKISLDRLRKEYVDDIQAVKNGEYDNLSTEELFVYITDADVITGSIERSNDNYKDMSLLEVVEAEYCTYPYLAYIGSTKSDEDKRYCHVPCDMDYVVFMRGKLFELMEDLETESEPIKIYYSNGDNLDDEYQLSNGKISVGNAITFVEKYFAELYPYNIYPEIKEKVHHVNVLNIGKGIYGYEFSMVREFGGLIADAECMITGINKEVYDTTKVTMVETNDIDMRIGSGNGHVMEKGDDVLSEVVSLKSALELVSSKICSNSKYEIKEISMIFRRKVINDILYQQEYIC